MRKQWFTEVEVQGRQKFQVDDRVKKLITYNELNLMAQWPFKGKFDVIFCRNVVIYFDEPTQMKIWSRFAGCCPRAVISISAIPSACPAMRRTVFDNIGITTYRYTGQGHREAAHECCTRSCRRRFCHHARPDHGRFEFSDPDVRSSVRRAMPCEAREAIKELNPDVITLDIEMPNMNGLEFLEKIMRLRPMPVIMVSTLTHRGAECDAGGAGNRRLRLRRQAAAGRHAPVRAIWPKRSRRRPARSAASHGSRSPGHAASMRSPITASAARSLRSDRRPEVSRP
jgi:CheY-like chemotaxis protein